MKDFPKGVPPEVILGRFSKNKPNENSEGTPRYRNIFKATPGKNQYEFLGDFLELKKIFLGIHRKNTSGGITRLISGDTFKKFP